jgi:hypothetical protein
VNWAVEPEECARRDRVRLKLFGTMLLAYGYAMLGGSLWQPLSGAEPITAVNLAVAALGLVFHAIALYIAPKGES